MNKSFVPEPILCFRISMFMNNYERFSASWTLYMLQTEHIASTTSYHLSCVASRNTTFSSLAETWIPKLGKMETTNTAFTTRQREMDNI